MEVHVDKCRTETSIIICVSNMLPANRGKAEIFLGIGGDKSIRFQMI